MSLYEKYRALLEGRASIDEEMEKMADKADAKANDAAEKLDEADSRTDLIRAALQIHKNKQHIFGDLTDEEREELRRLAEERFCAAFKDKKTH